MILTSTSDYTAESHTDPPASHVDSEYGRQIIHSFSFDLALKRELIQTRQRFEAGIISVFTNTTVKTGRRVPTPSNRMES